jgi:hypothetical protein
MCPHCFRLERAQFGPLKEGGEGRSVGRFRERVWPVFCRPAVAKKPRHKPSSVCSEKYARSLVKRLRIEEARRWWPADALTRQWDRVDDILLARGR